MNDDEFAAVLDPAAFIGRCPEQVDRYLGVVRRVIGETAPGDSTLAV
ncbi:Uncharacterised protein [Arcanobacterium haemolyticum]|nr:hypothetical protein [Arcanobacterium haemolyticum]SPT75963.1 Uncharacterised protein [Arcanobacterium haemolyticum]